MQKTSTARETLPPCWRGKICLLVPLLLGCIFSMAQGQSVTGKVTDANSEPIPGVNIIVKGTTLGTTTDANGVYVIEVPGENQVLVFSFIGYAPQEVAVNNRNRRRKLLRRISLSMGATADKTYVYVQT